MRGSMARFAQCLALLGCMTVAATGDAHAQFRMDGGTSRLLRQAAALEASGDLEGAERVLLEVLDEEPRSAGALFALERVLRAQGEPEVILPLVEEFIRRDPEASSARLLQLRVLAELDSADALRSKAEDWMDGQPGEEGTYREIAGVYEGALGAEEALAVLERGREALGQESALALEIGDLRARAGDLDAALREWAAGVGDDGSQVAAVARRIRALPDDERPAAARALLDELGESPVFARRRAGAQLAVELRLEADALESSRAVAGELGGRARTGFLSETAERAGEVGLGAVAAWAYDQLGDDARTPSERRAFDERLVEVALAAGDTAAAVEPQRRIARSLPEGSADRRRAIVQALRLEAAVGEPGELRSALSDFAADYPDAPELDEVASMVARRLQARGEGAGASAVLEGVAGPRSALERGYLELGQGDTEAGRTGLLAALEGLSPTDATDVIRLAGLLGRLSPEAAGLVGLAAAEAHWGRAEEAVGLLEDGLAGVPEAERPEVLAHAARVADDGGRPEDAARLRTRLLEVHPDHAAVPEAALALARHHAARPEGVEQAIEILEELIASRPNAAVAPSARAELARLRGRP